MTASSLRPKFVEFIPEKLEGGILYISQRYRTATHLCCCGCGEEVVTPLGQTDWSLKVANGNVTLYPSIGNWSFACKSHYWIRDGKIVWAGSMTQNQIELGRKRDQYLRDAYFAEQNRQIDEKSAEVTNRNSIQAEHSSGWLSATWTAIRKWIGF